jgi:catechol 2,3-dioxygenase-like lactoylglutathione lyase family enzyme
MTVRRIDNVAINVDDLAAAIDFFRELGLELEGDMPMEGPLLDRLLGLENVRTHIATMRPPGGDGRIELTKFHTPAAISPEPKIPPPNMLGVGRIMFLVDDINDVVARLRTKGGELIGEVVQYEQSFLLCYLRGPEGILIALAEQLGR